MRRSTTNENVGIPTASSTIPTNSMGNSSSTPGTGGVDTYDPLIKTPKKLRDIVRRKGS